MNTRSVRRRFSGRGQRWFYGLMLLGSALGFLALAVEWPLEGQGAARAEAQEMADERPPLDQELAVLGDPPEMVRLAVNKPVWLDKANQRVVMVGGIVQRQGPMEMFACLRRTKEHESIVAVPTEAYTVHAALIAVGAKNGSPAQFRPEYRPATGTPIEVTVYWTDAQGKRQSARAQDWLRNVRTDKTLDQDWVFGGSSFWTDPRTGKQFYQAEEGDFVCVSNFASAMLDLPVESSQANEALLFEAIQEKIPPLGTKVTLVLTPHLKDLSPTRGGDPQADKFVRVQSPPVPPEGALPDSTGSPAGVDSVPGGDGTLPGDGVGTDNKPAAGSDPKSDAAPAVPVVPQPRIEAMPPVKP